MEKLMELLKKYEPEWNINAIVSDIEEKIITHMEYGKDIYDYSDKLNYNGKKIEVYYEFQVTNKEIDEYEWKTEFELLYARINGETVFVKED